MNRVGTSTSESRPWRAAVVLGVIGAILTAVVMVFTVADARRSHDADLEADGYAVSQAFDETIDSVADHLVAVKGLFISSDVVTPGEFRSFVDELGLPDGVVAVGFAARTRETPTTLFEAHAGFSRADNAPVFTLGPEGERLPLEPADHHDILIFTAPGGEFDEMIGLDLASVSPAREVIHAAMIGDAMLATPPFEPLMGFDGTEFLVFQRVANTREGPSGWAVALLDLDRMIGDGLAGRLVPEDRITISDVGADRAEGTWSTVLAGFGRQWQVDVAPSAPFSVWTSRRVAAVVIGLFVSLAAALLIAAGLETRRARREIERLAAARRQTDRLLSDLSHQLRTPLTVILGFLDEVSTRWDVLPERDRLEMLDLAERGALDMGALVDDLLVRERMVAGVSIPVSAAPMDVVAEVEGVSAELDVPIEIRVSGSGVPVVGDRHRVRQVVRNLIENAVHHGEPPVEVAVETSGSECTIIVRDGGTGVPNCCQVGLFDLEVVQHRHDHPRVSGQGVGLPVARFLVEAMGGELYYDGAVHDFVMRLPVAVEGVVAA